MVLAFGQNNPDLVVPRPASPNSSTHSERTRNNILQANQRFGHDSLCLTMAESDQSLESEAEVVPDANIDAPDAPVAVADGPAAAADALVVDAGIPAAGVHPTVVTRTVLGGVCIFKAMLDFSLVQVPRPDFNWYKVTSPAELKSGPDGALLLGYHSVDAPVFQYQDKALTRNVGLQVWPSNDTATTQTDTSTVGTGAVDVAVGPSNDDSTVESLSPEEFLRYQRFDSSRADKEALVAANIELDK